MSTRKALRSEINRLFGPVLEPMGFGPGPGPGQSFFLERQTDGAHLHVDIDLHHDGSAFSVFLHVIKSVQDRKRIELGEFAGIQGYSIGNGSPEEIRLPAELAKEHLITYGLPWLSGHDVSTPALEERRRLANERNQRDLTRRGREAYRSKEWDVAVHHLKSAEALGPLDSVSQKILDYALQKVSKGSP